jgi:ABC-type uncharacterized transport system substrate-binding protein
MSKPIPLPAPLARCVARILIFAALCIPSIRAMAHPHVWISYAVTTQTKDHKLIAISETWVFSKGFPVSLAGDFSDAPKSGPFDAKHTAMIYDQAFSALKNTGYFTHVYVDGKAVELAEAKNFSAATEDHRMVYRFLVPLKTPIDIRRAPVEIGVWDDTFFVDFQGATAQPVALDAALRTCKIATFEDKDHPIFGGSIIPTASKISC